MFLNADELYAITGYKRPKDQRRRLDERGIPYEVGAAGRPKVCRAAYEHHQIRQIGDEPRSDAPNWSGVR